MTSKICLSGASRNSRLIGFLKASASAASAGGWAVLSLTSSSRRRAGSWALGQDRGQLLARQLEVLPVEGGSGGVEHHPVAAVGLDLGQPGAATLVGRIDGQHLLVVVARHIGPAVGQLAVGLFEQAGGGAVARVQQGGPVERVAGIGGNRLAVLGQAVGDAVVRDQLVPFAVGPLPGAAGQGQSQRQHGGARRNAHPDRSHHSNTPMLSCTSWFSGR
jgi:hypothetical protein